MASEDGGRSLPEKRMITIARAPSAAMPGRMGLSPQEIADLAQYLKSL